MNHRKLGDQSIDLYPTKYFFGKSLKISHKQHFPVFSDSEFSYNLPQAKPELNLEMKVKLRIPPPPPICFILLQVFV